MRLIISTLLIICTTQNLLAQDCGSSYINFTGVDTTFSDDSIHYGNIRKIYQLRKRKLIIEGWVEITKKNDTTISEFMLTDCQNKKQIGFWGALQPSHISQQNDTLLIAELINLPIGHNFDYYFAPVFLNKFFFVNNTLKKKKVFNTTLQHYSNSQIQEVFKLHATLNKKDYEKIIEVADMLFWSYVSGNTQAEKRLNEFKSKFGPFDGHVAEEWDSIWETYLLYKKIK